MCRPATVFLVSAVLAAAAGCASSETTAASGGRSSGEPGGSGWRTERDQKADLTRGSTTYGTFPAKRGQQVRATVKAQPDPVELRLYVTNNKGEEKTLAERKDVKDAVLEGQVPYDGTLMLSVRLEKGQQTTATYKIESR